MSILAKGTRFKHPQKDGGFEVTEDVYGTDLIINLYSKIKGYGEVEDLKPLDHPPFWLHMQLREIGFWQS